MHNSDTLVEAASLLQQGRLVAFATDTVYGIGALPVPDATAAIFAAKGRPTGRALPLLLAKADEAPRHGAQVPESALLLTSTYWPGPLTLVVPATEDLARALGAENPSAGIRVPKHDPLRELLRLAGGALAVSSANRSGETESLSAEEVQRALGAHVVLILDGGQSQTHLASTVVDVTTEPPRILRAGSLAAELSRLLDISGETGLQSQGSGGRNDR